MDQHVPRALTEGLRLRGVDVMTAYEDGASQMEDSELLDRATELGRVLFTQDDDLLVEAAVRQRKGNPFRGVIYAHQMRASNLINRQISHQFHSLVRQCYAMAIWRTSFLILVARVSSATSRS